MSRWTRFTEWCREPSKIKIRSFNPKNIMVIELSILIVSLITSGTYLLQVPSIIPPQHPSMFISMSGDGTKIAYTSYISYGVSEVFVVNSDGTGLTQLTNNQALNFHASISDDGTKVAFHSNVDGDDEIFVVNSDGTGLTQLTDNTVRDSYPSISSDGTKIAFMSYIDSGSGGGSDIFVINSDGTGLIRLCGPGGSHERDPSISGDGTKVAFHSWAGGQLGICVANSDGTSGPSGIMGVTDDINYNSYASISGDGTKIAYTSKKPGWTPSVADHDDEIFVVNSDGTGLTQLTDNAATDSYASICGDGTKVAFHSNVDGDDEIFVVNSDGTGLTQLTSNNVADLHASISDDGTKVAYTSNVNGDWEVFVVSLESNSYHMPIAMSEIGVSFPLEYVAAWIVAVIVAVALVVIFLVRKKIDPKGVKYR